LVKYCLFFSRPRVSGGQGVTEGSRGLQEVPLGSSGAVLFLLHIAVIRGSHYMPVQPTWPK